MKKIILTTFILLQVVKVVNSQTIPNASFENWEEKGSDPFKYTDLKDWNTLNYLSQYGYPILAEKIAEPIDGSFAVKLTTKEYNSGSGKDTLPAWVRKRFPVSSLPNYFNGYYKSNVLGKDTATISLLAPTGPLTGIIIATVNVVGKVDQYVSFSVPVNTFGLGSFDSLEISLTTKLAFINSPYKNVYSVGTTITVDNLSFSDTPLSLDDQTKEISPIQILPNPSEGVFRLSHTQQPIENIEIFNSSGQKVYANNIYFSENIIDLSGESKGVLFLHGKAGEKSFSKKIIIK